MLGIITEYNPFHNGHKLHIDKSKIITNSNDCIVVMSGNFVQRGEPAIFDKYIRTKMALLNGASLVLELPTIFSTASAELFSLGAVDILNKTGIITKICFGAETNCLNDFLAVSKILSDEPDIFKYTLLKELKKGLSYPVARSIALKNTLNINTDFLANPNNILAIEYFKALNKLNSNIVPYIIKREHSDFHSKNINSNIASATAIRNAFATNSVQNIKCTMPSNCFGLIKDFLPYNPPSINDYSSILSYILRTTNIKTLKKITGMTEGLENKILSNLDFTSVSSLIDAIKSKRYTYSKLQRLMLHIVLNITKNDQPSTNQSLNQYIRVLGFKKSSSHILNNLIKNSKVPVITNLKSSNRILDESSITCLNNEIVYSDIYYINKNKKLNQDYKSPLIII